MTTSAAGSLDRDRRPARIGITLSGLELSGWLWLARQAVMPPPTAELVCVFRPAYVRLRRPVASRRAARPYRGPQCAVSRTRVLTRDRAAAPGTRPPRMSRAPGRPAGWPTASLAKKAESRNRLRRFLELMAGLWPVSVAVAKAILVAAAGGATGGMAQAVSAPAAGSGALDAATAR